MQVLVRYDGYQEFNVSVVCTVVERRSPAGRLSLSNARLAADG